MILTICAVMDSAINAFGRPIFVPAKGAALRSFMDEINRPGSDFHLHPDDFTLYTLGHFNDETGEFIPGQMVLARGKDVKNDAP